ncbi:MAG: AzlD domain-containing protein [Pseudomonadales bacterium]
MIQTLYTSDTALIALLAALTLATRLGGVFAMDHLPIGPRLARFISAMASAVLAALLAPIALTSDSGGQLALGATLCCVLFFKRPMLAVALGLVTAAGYRALLS